MILASLRVFFFATMWCLPYVCVSGDLEGCAVLVASVTVSWQVLLTLQQNAMPAAHHASTTCHVHHPLTSDLCGALGSAGTAKRIQLAYKCNILGTPE